MSLFPLFRLMFLTTCREPACWGPPGGLAVNRPRLRGGGCLLFELRLSDTQRGSSPAERLSPVPLPESELLTLPPRALLRQARAARTRCGNPHGQQCRHLVQRRGVSHEWCKMGGCLQKDRPIQITRRTSLSEYYRNRMGLDFAITL